MIEIRRKFLDEDYCFEIISKSRKKVEPTKTSMGHMDTSVRNMSTMVYRDNNLKQKVLGISDLSELEGITDNLYFQFAEYNEGQFFRWHDDGLEMKSHIILLNNDFEGGELEFKDNEDLNLGVGDCVTYYSKLKHRVKPVLSGVRYSLVAWEFPNDVWKKLMQTK